MRPSLPVILLFLFLMLCLAAAYFLASSLQKTNEAQKQQPAAETPTHHQVDGEAPGGR